MPAPSTVDEFLDLVRKSGLVDSPRLEACLLKAGFADHRSSGPRLLADILVHEGLLTTFQADCLSRGKSQYFTIGRNKVLEKLGSGRMTRVFLCDEADKHRVVAVKVLPSRHAARDASYVARFQREVMCLASVQTLNVASAYGIGEFEGYRYAVMEYVRGSSLRQIVERTKPLQPTRAANYISQVAVGLKQVHGQGLIHRDIEPGNVMLDCTGTVKIVDFGAARAINDASLPVVHSNLIIDGLLKPDFAAPELAGDQPVDHRADIYSLGATLYFCLTGRPPVDGETPSEKLEWLRSRRPPPLRSLRPEVPPAMAAVIERMMAKEPGDRFSSAQDVADALAPWTKTPIAPPPDDEMPHWCPATTAAIARSRSAH